MSRLIHRLDGAYETFMEHLNEAEYDSEYTCEEFLVVLMDRFGKRVTSDYADWYPSK